MPRWYCVNFSSEGGELSQPNAWPVTRDIFQEFGAIKKLYIKGERGAVYFETKAEAEAACVGVKDTFTVEPVKEPSTHYNDDYNNSFMVEDGIYGSMEPAMFDIFGHKISVLHADDGEKYVPLVDVQKCGLTLYNDNMASKMTAADTGDVKKLEAYLLNQARVFAHMERLSIKPGLVNSLIEKTVSDVLTSKVPENRKITISNDLAHPKMANGVGTSSSNASLNDTRGERSEDRKVELAMNTNNRVKIIYEHMNESILWVHLVENEQLIQQLDYDTLVEANKGVVISPYLDLICAVKFTQVWRRARVIKIDELDSRVFLLDLGRTTQIVPGDCRSLPEELCAIPAQAVRIKISTNCVYTKDDSDEIIIFPIRKYSTGTYLVNTVDKSADSSARQSPIVDNRSSNYKNPSPRNNYNRQSDGASNNFDQNTNNRAARPQFNNRQEGVSNRPPSQRGGVSSYGNKHSDDGNRGSRTQQYNNSTRSDADNYNKSSSQNTGASYNNKQTKVMPPMKSTEVNENIPKTGTSATAIHRVEPKPSCATVKAEPEPSTAATNNVERPTVSRSAILKQNMAVKQENAKPKRDCIFNMLGFDDGILQYKSHLDAESFLGFIFPNAAVDIIESFESIGKSVVDDPNFTADVGDTVAVEHLVEEVATWVRGTIIKIIGDTFQVALFDWGEVITVTEVRKLPEEFLETPEFCSVIEGDKKFVATLKHAHESALLLGIEQEPLSYTTTDKLGKLSVHHEGNIHVVECKQWEPIGKIEEKKALQRVVTTMPGIQENIKVGADVKLIGEHNGRLGLRTKELTSKFNGLRAQLATHIVQKLDTEPIVGQLALQKSDDNLCRVVIRSINGSEATVYQFDCGQTVTVPIRSLYYINSFAAIDTTLPTFKLNGHEEGFTRKGIEYLTSNFKKAIYNVTSVNNDVVSLQIQGKDLSEILRDLDKPCYKRLQDLESCSLDVGTTVSAVAIYTEELDRGIIAVLAEVFSETFATIDTLLSQYYAETPLNLHMDELCVGNYQGSWCRAAVSEILPNNKYRLYYIDYGNTDVVDSSNIKAISEELKTFPRLAITCTLSEFGNPVPPAIVEKIVEMDDLNIKVLAKDGDQYEITIPNLVSPKLLASPNN